MGLPMKETTTKKKKDCYVIYHDGEAFVCCEGDEGYIPKHKRKVSKKKEN